MKYQSPKGYNRSGYSWANSLRTYANTRQMPYVEDGAGHRAGENWADQNKVDPYATQRKYSPYNSPSFDEGVWLSKQKRRKQGTQSPYYQKAQGINEPTASVLPYMTASLIKQKMAGKMQQAQAGTVAKKPNSLVAKIARKI